MANIILNVNRQRLVDQLTAKRAEIIADYVAQRQKLADMLTSITSSTESWTAYHQSIVDGLTAGTLKVNDSGKIVSVERGGEVPRRPDAKAATHGVDSTRWTKADIEHNIEQLGENEYYYTHDVSPYDAAIQLLELSDEETVQIDGSNYNHLLGRGIRNWGW